MRQIYTTLKFILLALAFGLSMQAQTTYTVSSNTSWNATYGAGCSNCIFNISAGKTLSIDKNITCSTCTFNGGTVSITQDLICQPCVFSSNTITITNKMLKPNSSTTSFTNVNLTANGTSFILANTAVNISGSTFIFNNTSYYSNNSSTLNMTSSSMNFNNDAYFTANGGPVNLKSSSTLVAGDGTISSTSYIKMNGPALNIYDNSSITIKNKNNSYFNWGSYNLPTIGSSVSTASNSLNCGGANPHGCSSPNVYGCASLNSSGMSACSILPVILTDFSVQEINGRANLSWFTSSELGFDHFTIERSTDNMNWKVIAVVQAKYETNSSEYSYQDVNALGQTSYYRLEMTDKDGKSSYSKIIVLKSTTTAVQVSIYPNPITNLSFTLQLNSVAAAVLNVMSMEGRLIYSASLNGQSQYQVKLPNAANSYNYLIVQVISNGSTKSFNVLNRK